MKTITTSGLSAPQENVTAPEDPVVLSGPPGALHGVISLRNQTGDRLFVRDFALQPAKGKKSADFETIGTDRLAVRTRLLAGEARSQQIHLALGRQTPPGTYEATVSIGKKDVPVRLVVQPVVDVELSPDELFFTGVEPGRTHTAEVLLLNRGNVPVTVPTLKHATTVDTDLVCRSLSQAIRDHGEDGSQATLDALAKTLAEDLAGWVKLSVKNAGAVVEPGASTLMEISLTLPDDVRPERTYEGDIRVLDELLSYLILPESPKRRPSESSA